MNDHPTTNPLLGIRRHGQCVWLDNLDRRLLDDGGLQRLIDEDGLHGVTSNPAIFKQAIADSHTYDGAIAELARGGASTLDIYRALTVADVQRAADLLRPVYDGGDGAHGFVSLEVDPHLARDTEGTVAEARALWAAVDRPNVMIKVPGTREGVPAVRTLVAEGVNVNVTLLFGLDQYRDVAEAYVAGLRDRAARGEPLERVASVASFFLSRIDTLVDGRLDERGKADDAAGERARALRGETAVACAREAYRIFRELFAPDAFGDLAVRGARPQRLLWASTSTKDPAYADVKYVEPLIGPETVTTLPGKTLDAYRDHGKPARRLDDHEGRARRVLADLGELGIDLAQVTDQLVAEGIDKFNAPYDALLRSLDERRAAARERDPATWTLDAGPHLGLVQEKAAELASDDVAARIWRRDTSVWTDDSAASRLIAGALGWLDVAATMRDRLGAIDDFVRGVRADGFTHVVHAGMGGSSMTPLVLTRALPRGDGAPEVTVLDTTDPRTIDRLLRRLPLDRTLFLLASKSGTTTETRCHGDLFLAAVREQLGERAGGSFAVITDPDSPLAELAAREHFRAAFLNPPDIGGRYSALSYFGLVPAALHGVDLAALLDRADAMIAACGPDAASDRNPALELGAALGALAGAGRDKITFVTPPVLANLGLWLEQLLAESTGKEGRGLVPVAGEPLGRPGVYGNDRVFVRFRLGGARDAQVDGALAALNAAGHPLVTIDLADPLDLAREFFRWELAVAVAGRCLGIDPFDQPNVQESKENTARLLEEGAAAAAAEPTVRSGGLAYFAERAAPDAGTLLRRFAADAGAGRYLALQAYLPPDDPDLARDLDELRRTLRDRLRVSVTLGYGPRFLHSTGQLHKGGPDTGLFLQLTSTGTVDPAVPGRGYTFGVLERAQADGDLAALRRRGRPALRIDLGEDPGRGLASLLKLTATTLPAARAHEGGA